MLYVVFNRDLILKTFKDKDLRKKEIKAFVPIKIKKLKVNSNNYEITFMNDFVARKVDYTLLANVSKEELEELILKNPDTRGRKKKEVEE